MTCGIYEIKNKQENRVYIGQSLNIESRWKSHLYMNPINTNLNLLPTLELANDNPEMVDFNIVKQFPEGIYSKDEMKFILSIHEKHELELRGGYKSPRTINERPIHIPKVNPSLFTKYPLPDFVDSNDVLSSVVSWAKSKKDEEISLINYKDMYYNKLSENIKLSNQLSEKNKTVNPKEQMSRDYEIFKLKQRISELEDEKEELQERVSFWKNRCKFWRNSNGE